VFRKVQSILLHIYDCFHYAAVVPLTPPPPVRPYTYYIYGGGGAQGTEGRRPQKPPSATAHYAFKTPSTTHSVVFRL